MPRLGVIAESLDRGADDTQHTAMPQWVNSWQVNLLDGAQSLGRCGITSQDDKIGAHGEELIDRLERKTIYHIERAGAVRSARIVAEVDIIVVREHLAHRAENGQSAIAGIKKSNHLVGNLNRHAV